MARKMGYTVKGILRARDITIPWMAGALDARIKKGEIEGFIIVYSSKEAAMRDAMKTGADGIIPIEWEDKDDESNKRT